MTAFELGLELHEPFGKPGQLAVNGIKTASPCVRSRWSDTIDAFVDEPEAVYRFEANPKRSRLAKEGSRGIH